MKYFNVLAVMLVGFLMVNHAQAARHDVLANIGEIRYHESTNGYAVPWRNIIWFSLINPSKTFNCPQNGGLYKVAFPADQEALVSMMLAAKMADKRVKVTIDDSVLLPAGGYCKVQYLNIL